MRRPIDPIGSALSTTTGLRFLLSWPRVGSGSTSYISPRLELFVAINQLEICQGTVFRVVLSRRSAACRRTWPRSAWAGIGGRAMPMLTQTQVGLSFAPPLETLFLSQFRRLYPLQRIPADKPGIWRLVPSGYSHPARRGASRCRASIYSVADKSIHSRVAKLLEEMLRESHFGLPS